METEMKKVIRGSSLFFSRLAADPTERNLIAKTKHKSAKSAPLRISGANDGTLSWQVRTVWNG